MPLGLDRPTLSPVDPSTVQTAPRKSRQGEHFLLKRVVCGDGHLTRSIHLPHLLEKVQAVIRPPLQDIELPLVDHLMGEGIQEFLLRVGRSLGEPFQQRERETNLSAAAAHCGERR